VEEKEKGLDVSRGTFMGKIGFLAEERCTTQDQIDEELHRLVMILQDVFMVGR